MFKKIEINQSGVSVVRSDGRATDQLREIDVKIDEFGFADGSVLLSFGKTKVLCSISLSEGVPPFLKGKGTGWLTAEYAMLPCSTNKRSIRESSLASKNSRSVEISRLIGRSLRTVCDLNLIGERTINIDCDVLQADGGTRVCAISGSCLALEIAQRKWLDRRILKKPILKERIAGVSVIVSEDFVLLDPSQSEDSDSSADFNFILTESGKIIEIQGTSEKTPLDWDKFDGMCSLAIAGTENILKFFQNWL